MKRIILLLLFVARLVRAYDANANQQSDIWEIAYGVSGVAPTADAGGDDFMNAIESLAGTNPLNGADFPQTGLMPGLPALITGAINEVGHPASGALVQDIVAPQHRVVAFAVQRFAINLAWSLGPATAGLLEAHSQLFWLFVVDAATSAFFGVIAWLFLPRGRRTQASQAGWGHARVSIRQNKPFLALFGAAGHILMGASFLVFQSSGTLPAFVLMMVVFTEGQMTAFSRQHAYAASMAPEHMRERYVGFLRFAQCAGNTASSALGMTIFDRHPGTLWTINACLGIVAALLIVSRTEQNTP